MFDPDCLIDTNKRIVSYTRDSVEERKCKGILSRMKSAVNEAVEILTYEDYKELLELLQKTFIDFVDGCFKKYRGNYEKIKK